MSFVTFNNIRQLIAEMVPLYQIYQRFFDEDGFLCIGTRLDPLEGCDPWQLAKIFPVVLTMHERILIAEERTRELEEHMSFDQRCTCSGSLKYCGSCFEEISEKLQKAEARVLELEAEIIKSKKAMKTSSDLHSRELKKVLDLEGKALDQSLEIYSLRENLGQLETLLARKDQVDQAVQAVVEQQTCAVEAHVPAESCERASQTISPQGNGHGCCERAVQTAKSFTKPVSGVCWKCGQRGHFRKHCRNKGRRRRFTRKKAKNHLQTCTSTYQGSSQPGQAVWVLTVSNVGGLIGWGCKLQRPMQPLALQFLRQNLYSPWRT